MVAAVAMFAAASCTQELENNAPEAKGETVVYTASTDGADTKAVLDGTVSKWCGEELITLHDGINAFTFYANAGETPVLEVDFTYTPGEGQPVFTATEVMAIYPSGDYTANVSDKTVSNIVIPNNQTLADNTYPATSAVAVAHSTTTDLSFKNATTLLKFKVAGDDVTFGCIAAEGDISGTFDLAYNDGEPILTATTANQWVDFSKNDEFLSKDATYYIAVAPAELNKITMYLNGTEVKSKTFEQPYKLKRNVILDLGTVTYTAPETASTVYLKPGVWSVDGAWYVAYFFNSTGNVAVKMEKDADGLFEAAVPEGDYSKVIFCRMNPKFTEFGWDVWEGETMVEDHVWDQTANLSVPVKADDKLCYVVKDWNVYEWQTLEDAKYVAPEFVAQEGYIYLQPSSKWLENNARFAAYFFNGTWADMTLVEGQKDIYQCAIPEGEINVIFCRMNPSATENSWTNKWNQTGDLKMTDGSLYIVSGWDEGSWTGDPAVTEPEPEPVVLEWGIVGLNGDWDNNVEMTLVDGWYVAENVTIKTTDGFKFRVGTTWDKVVTYTASVIAADTEYETIDGQGTDNEMKVAVSAIYSVYLSLDATTMKVVKTAELPVESVPDQPSDWALAGTFNSWADAAMVTTTVPDLFVVKNVALDAYAELKVKRKASGADNGWGTSYGVKSVNYINSNVWVSVQSGSGTNLSVIEKGTYDIYFDLVNIRLYVMKAGVDYSTSIEQTTNGKAPVISNARTIYLKAGSWTDANAWFIAYTWGGASSAAMVRMEKSSKGNNIYECEVPKDRTNIIFLRKNPSNTSMDWNGEWNRFEMTLPADKNCFTINGWEAGGWSNI